MTDSEFNLAIFMLFWFIGLMIVGMWCEATDPTDSVE